MLFYASEKYPEEDSYSKYITEVIYILTLSSNMNSSILEVVLDTTR